MLIGDTLSSLVSGMGTSIDKAMSLFWTTRALDQANLDAAYRGDWIARKVVDIPPNDATREWRNWQADDNQIQALEESERRLGVRAKVRRALQLGRLYGGAALLIGDGAPDPSKPFDPEAVKKNGLRYLHVFPRWRLGTSELEWDPESPYFGTPATYQIPIGRDRQQISIHPSRVIQFIGQPTPDPFTDGQLGWGDSILQSIGDAVRQAGLATQTIASLLTEAKTDSIGIPNLFTYLTTAEGEAAVRKRYALAAEMKSLYQTVIRDAAEVWDTRQISFAQLPDILREYLQIAAGAADIPATRLLGKAPQGLNATGESDLVNYYNMVGSLQENELRPMLMRLDEALILDALGRRPPEVHYEWAPLWQPTEAEKADVALKKAQATQIYAVNDLLAPEVLAKIVPNQLVEDGTYPGLEAAQEDYEAGLLELPEFMEPDEPVAPPGAEPAIDPATGLPVKDAAPRTLYVSRKVLNAAEIIAWAKGQGIADLLDDLHVTIAYSRTPIDWMKIDGDWNANDRGEVTVPPGGVRIVEPLGDMTAVLLFTSSTLSWRHEQIIRAGASYDFDQYQPHISLTKAQVDLEGVEPYQGRIELGPERFAEIVTQDGGGPNADRPFVEDKRRRRRGGSGSRGHFNPGQPRGPNGRWISTGASQRKPLAMGWPGGKRMKAFVDHATANPASKARLHFGPARNAAAVRSATGLDVDGWKRKLGADEVRKILKDHGVAASENARGQVAVTRSDFKRIRSIVEKPDRISAGGATRGRGLQSIVYEKHIGGVTYTLVEEMQPKRMGLQVKTMWKR